MLRLRVLDKEANFSGTLEYVKEGIYNFHVLTSGYSSFSVEFLNIKENSHILNLISKMKNVIKNGVENNNTIDLTYFYNEFEIIKNRLESFECNIRNAKPILNDCRYAYLKDDDEIRLLHIKYPIKITGSEHNTVNGYMIRIYINDLKGNAVCLQLGFNNLNGDLKLLRKQISKKIEFKLIEEYNKCNLINIENLINECLTNLKYDRKEIFQAYS